MTVPTPQNPPGSGNKIVGQPPTTPMMLAGGFVVGMTVWFIEQNAGVGPAMLFAVIILLGILVAQRGYATTFTAELQAIMSGKF